MHRRVSLAATGTAGSVRDTCVNDGAALDDNAFGLKLVVYFIQDCIVQASLCQCVPETANGGAL